jgi:uncharacterized C2H2 Zn-finger protein
MLSLPPDIMRLLVLRCCDPRDAHYLAKTCTSIRRYFDEEELQRFRSGVVRYKILCKRYHWSQFPERWNNRKECPHCGAVLQSQRRYNQHVAVCDVTTEPCPWCHLNFQSGSHDCVLQPGVKCGNAHHGFKRCEYEGIREEVKYHSTRCKLECLKCGKLCSKRRVRYHGNIVSDRCDGMIYTCPNCKQLWNGAYYGSHQPCLPDLTFHQPGSKSSVSKYCCE